MKIRAIILTVFFALLTLGNAAYADSSLKTAGADIKGAIERDYTAYYADTLEAQKENFHSSNRVSFLEATLGEGIAYYQANIHGESLSHELIGYKFPLYLEGTQVAVIDATFESGAWKIFNISNNDNFSNTIKRIESEYAKDGTLELIDDKRYNLNYLYINTAVNEEYINLTNNESISPTEIMSVVSQSESSFNNSNRNSNDGAILVGGGQNVSSADNHTSLFLPILLFGLSLIFAVPLIVIATQRKRASVTLR
ncbi:hypothetical protein MKX42_10055 [Paenibacillus sp. FSL R7-0204]|uniref:hypothetical protein n=1 Tax=Paenibacillus sp. FSL R7-0204 TaxID=2921675 RepID=UPI0030F6CE4D